MSESPSAPDDAPSQGVDFGAVAKVAARIRLSDVHLRWSQLGIFADEDPTDPEWSSKAFLSFESRPAFDEEARPEPGEALLIQCLFQLRYFADLDANTTDPAPEFDAESPPDIAIEAVFDLTYAAADWEGISESDVQQFALANGTHNAWPYWREYAQATSVRLGLEPYIVGPFKLPSRHDPKKDEQQD